MKSGVFLLCLLAAYSGFSLGVAETSDTCVVRFGEKNIGSGAITDYSAFMSTDHSHLKDYDQYPACKRFCETAQIFQAKKRSCFVQGQEIEASSFKTLFYDSLPRRCTIYQALDSKWLYRKAKSWDLSLSSAFGFSNHILDSKTACSQQVEQIYGCRDGVSQGCIAFYGADSISTKSHIYAALYLYKYYILIIVALILVLVYLIRKGLMKIFQNRRKRNVL